GAASELWTPRLRSATEARSAPIREAETVIDYSALGAVRGTTRQPRCQHAAHRVADNRRHRNFRASARGAGTPNSENISRAGEHTLFSSHVLVLAQARGIRVSTFGTLSTINRGNVPGPGFWQIAPSPYTKFPNHGASEATSARRGFHHDQQFPRQITSALDPRILQLR